MHCLLNNEKVVLRIDKEDTVASVMERAMGLGPKVDQNLVPRLYDSEGYLLPIGPSIEENSDDNLYQLSFVAGINQFNEAKRERVALQKISKLFKTSLII